MSGETLRFEAPEPTPVDKPLEAPTIGEDKPDGEPVDYEAGYNELRRRLTEIGEERKQDAEFREAFQMLQGHPSWPDIYKFLQTGGEVTAADPAPDLSTLVNDRITTVLDDLGDPGERATALKELLALTAQAAVDDSLAAAGPAIADSRRTREAQEIASGMTAAGLPPAFADSPEFVKFMATFSKEKKWLGSVLKEDRAEGVRLVAEAYKAENTLPPAFEDERQRLEAARRATLESAGSRGGSGVPNRGNAVKLDQRRSKMAEIYDAFDKGFPVEFI